MLNKVLRVFGIASFVFALCFVGSPVPNKKADASLRHECNCKRVRKEIWPKVRGRYTIWGTVKARAPRIKYTKECDVKWHLNPFYHTGACD